MTSPRGSIDRDARRSAADVAAAAQLACLLEVSARKPGNVSRARSFYDVSYEDFLASASAIGGPLAGVGGRGAGETVRLCIEATARWTRSNTNLGMVLLLVPLARASLVESPGASRDPGWPQLRGALREVLEATTVQDAAAVYAAIRLARPGGLGRVPAQDVNSDPTVTLLEAMQLAAGRDGVAREYATVFETTFDVGRPALRRARRDGLSWEASIIETYFAVLANAPDTHVARRAGEAFAAEIAELARQVVRAGGVRSAAGRQAIAELEQRLEDPDHLGNPGTSADITAASIFATLLEDGWLSVADRA